MCDNSGEKDEEGVHILEYFTSYGILADFRDD